MKYLKRFDEELNVRTYRNAAKRLSDLGDKERSGKLDKYSNEVLFDKIRINYLKNVDRVKKNGKVNIYLTGINTVEYYFEIYTMFEKDSYGERIYINFGIKFYPVDFDKFIEKESEHTSKENILSWFYDDGSLLDSFDYFNIQYDITDDGMMCEFVSIEIGTPGTIKIIDRKSGHKIKKELLDHIIENKDKLYDYFDTKLGYGIDYGFDIDDMINDVRNYSVNKFYLATHKN
jgi:hypothetical protein